MQQDNMENKIKSVFDSIDDWDSKEAMSRKEAIWNSIAPDESKGKSKPWLLLALLGMSLLGAGWYIGNTNIFKKKSPQIEQNIKSEAANAHLMAIAQLESTLLSKKQQLDSLQKINKNLAFELNVLNSRMTQKEFEQMKSNTVYLKDTLYITEVKVETRIIEKRISDTVLVEVPILAELETISKVVDNENVNKPDLQQEAVKAEEVSKSVQFNFTETEYSNK